MPGDHAPSTGGTRVLRESYKDCSLVTLGMIGEGFKSVAPTAWIELGRKSDGVNGFCGLRRTVSGDYSGRTIHRCYQRRRGLHVCQCLISTTTAHLSIRRGPRAGANRKTTDIHGGSIQDRWFFRLSWQGRG